jgi:hypothetical protein
MQDLAEFVIEHTVAEQRLLNELPVVGRADGSEVLRLRR